MRLKRFLRNGLIYTLVLSFCLISVPKPAHAANLNTLINILRQIEQVTPPGTLPVTADEVESSKGLLECMINAGGDMYAQGLCADDFLESTEQIPDWVPFCLELYILLASHDYYGLANKLATDPQVVCAILSILIPGPPICDLLAELVELAEGLYDVGKVVYEFFGDVLGAAYGAAKDAYCATAGHVLGGCSDDDGPDIPPEVFVYKRFFHPRLAEGLTARKSTDSGAYYGLVEQIRNAAAVFAQNYQPDGFPDADTFLAIFCSDPGVVKRAADMYTSTVNSLWTADLAQTVLPQRSEKFNQYDNPANINNLAQAALQKFSPGYAWTPQDAVVNSCVQTFANDYGFAHIDTWLNMVNQLGDEAKALQPAVQSNRDLCKTFWNLKKKDIGEVVYAYAKQNHCGQFGSALQCKSIPDYRSCLALLTPFDSNDRCRANTLFTGKEAADQVMQRIKAKGTAHPEKWRQEKPTSSGQMIALYSEKPYRLVGYRPTHVYFCDQYYSEEFGDLPQKLLQCGYQADQDYIDLVADVEDAVKELNKQRAKDLIVGRYWDPLLVESPTAVSELQQENPSFGFQSPSEKPGFNYSPFAPQIGIDGVNTPLIFFDIQGAVAEHMNELRTPVRDIRDMIDPRLDAGKMDIQDRVSNVDAKSVVQLKSKAQLKAGVQKNVMVSAPGALAGQQAAGGQQVMSGTLPPGQQPPQSPTLSSAKFKIGAAGKSPVSMTQQGSPDLEVDGTLVINGRKVRWNGTIALDTATLKSAGNGRFQVPTVVAVKNTGNALSSPCRIAWPTMAEILPLPELKPGQVHNVQATIQLAPGIHRLQLQLDKLQQIQESNEQNNTSTVTLRISDNVNSSSRGVSPSSPATPRSLPVQTPGAKTPITYPANSR
jgi:hypothetical protein